MNSTNSSKPPSTDGLLKKSVIPGSQRKKSGKKPGGQPGHKGTTLVPVLLPDEIILHPVTNCICGQDLSLQMAEKIESNQIFDLPPIKIKVTEHRREVKTCRCCHTKITAPLPAGANGSVVQYGANIRALSMFLMHRHLIPSRRVREIVCEIVGHKLSIGTLMCIDHDLICPEQLHANNQIRCRPVSGTRLSSDWWDGTLMGQ